MPTDNPRITFTLSEDMLERIEEYKFGNRVKNQTRAVVDLINRGLAVYDASVTKTEEPEGEQEEPFNPDYETAALKAAEILLKYKISTAPVFPLHILSSMPNVLVINFTEFADKMGIDRVKSAAMFGADSQDIVTFQRDVHGKKMYFVAFNQRLPFNMLQLAFARELGHIVLGHDNTRPEAEQTAEALFFARHLICPRPLIHSLLENGIHMTIELLGNLTGCYGRTLASIRQSPGAHIPARLNAKLKEQFAWYVNVAAGRIAEYPPDDSPLADFGTYMDNYEE